jgi:hypothetical protein
MTFTITELSQTGRLNFLPCNTLLTSQYTYTQSRKGQNILRIVNIEEIRVQDRLDDACNHGNWVEEARYLPEIPIDPIGDIHGAVRAQSEEVVRRDGLGLAGALQHEELRQDSDRLEPDGEGPEDLAGRDD